MPIPPFRREPLTFEPGRRPGGGAIGCVHPDGSITFRGHRYHDLREVPDGCLGFRADLPSTLEWRRLYRAIDPRRRKTRKNGG